MPLRAYTVEDLNRPFGQRVAAPGDLLATGTCVMASSPQQLLLVLNQQLF
jgi:hypothetical protein